MPSLALELVNLLMRWIHVIAAIMWIGDSFLFMWMDSSLSAPTKPRDGAVSGELWMVHSGGFYEVVKRRFLAPHEMPARLYWFKWQSYMTWISGFFLLGLVYYAGGSLYLLDPGHGPSLAVAAAIGLGSLVAGWLIYDALWMSPLARRPTLAALLSFALLVLATLGLTRVLSGRAAFIHVGALMGTIMAANVWRRIIPAQDHMLAATRAGTAVDVSLGARAKLRSTHNHYMTLPVLFTMLSNHFPSAYGSRLSWLVLTSLIVLGAAVKYVMNFGPTRRAWVTAAGLAALAGVVALTVRPSAPDAGAAAFAGRSPVTFADANAIFQRRCVTCHSVHPTNPAFTAPPSGIVLEDPARIHALAPRILVRAVTTKTMPLGNLTGMTDDERQTLGAWIAQGAPVAGGATPR